MGAGLSLIGAVAVPLGSGFVSGFLTRDEVKGWYSGLKKPKWNPPNWLFGPAWSVFYTSMGIASWAVARSDKKGRAAALGLYGAQLALNLAWTPMFFKAHALDAALVDITALLGLATAATVKMSEAGSPAVVAPLMAPYLAWVTFATALNAELLRLNPKETAVDWSKVKKSTKAKAGEAKAAAKEAGGKVAAKAKEAGAAAAAGADKVKQEVSHAAAELSKKAAEDTAALTAVAKEAVGGSAPPPPPAPSSSGAPSAAI